MTVAPIDAFMGFVDQRVNANPKFQDLFTFGPEKLPSLVTLAAQKCIENNFDLSQAPESIQQQVLLSSRNFTYWKAARCLCSDEVVVENNLALQARISKFSKYPEVDFFEHLFNETFLGCDAATRDALILHKRAVEPLSSLSKNQAKEILEKVIHVASSVISNPIFKTVACLFLAYHTYGLAWKILGFADAYILAKAVPLLSSALPAQVVAVAAKIFELRGFIWLGAYSLSRWIPVPSLKKWVFQHIMTGISYTLPFFIFVKVLTLSLQSYLFYSSQASFLGAKLSSLHASWIDLRLGRELVQARHRWVQENLNYRPELRAEAMVEAA